MKTQLWPCTAHPAICGWYLPILLPLCLGSVRDQNRRFASGWVKSCFASTIFGRVQWQLERLKEGGIIDREQE